MQANEKRPPREFVVTPQYLAWRRFIRNKGSVVGLAMLVAILLAVIVGPVVYPVDPDMADFNSVLAKPSPEHPLGTDEIGRDILSRLLHGGGLSILMGFMVVLLAGSIGTCVGSISGYLGNRIDLVVTQLTDIAMAFPAFLLALLTISILGPGMVPAMIAVGLSEVPRFVRIARAGTLSVKHSEYVQASIALGQSHVGILLRHILPNIIGPVIVQASLLLGVAILWAASLGFLGLGVQPPTSEWGNMLSNARGYLRIAPHAGIFPGLAIMVTVLAFNLVGDGLRAATDVRL
jgi:peptide/nickel transport system permease protein